MTIQIILGSTREGRFGEAVAKYVLSQAEKFKTAEIKFDYIDLKEHPLPFFADEKAPSFVLDGKYPTKEHTQWGKRIAKGDGYIILTPEYNHGYPAVLKNALDHLYHEWGNKPVAFIGYGGLAGGARSVEQLKQVVTELRMIPIREGSLIQHVYGVFQKDGTIQQESALPHLDKVFEDLIDWTKKLKKLREEK